MLHLAVADIANDTRHWEIWVSPTNLAKKARVSRSTCCDWLWGAALDLGMLELIEDNREVVGAKGRRNVPSRFRFLMPAGLPRWSDRPDESNDSVRSADAGCARSADAEVPVCARSADAAARGERTQAARGDRAHNSKRDNSRGTQEPFASPPQATDDAGGYDAGLGDAAFGDQSPSSPVKPAKRDLLFEAVVEACGCGDWASFTAKERASINAAVKELRDVGATPEQARERVAEASAEWRNGRSVTPHALAKYWSRFGVWVEETKSGNRPAAPPPRSGVLATMDHNRGVIERAKRRFAEMEADEAATNGNGHAPTNGRVVVDTTGEVAR